MEEAKVREKGIPNGSAMRQAIYDHGGSRIWIEKPDGGRELLADTYTTAAYAKAVRDFTEEWLRQNMCICGLKE